VASRPDHGLGISAALHDAVLLSHAVVTGRKRDMADFHRTQDRAARPAYDFTAMLAGLVPPRSAELALFTALANNSEYVDMYIAALTERSRCDDSCHQRSSSN
jgi:hypothetical protein